MKNLEEIENKDKIKEILDTTKISQRQPKNLKRILTSSTFGENMTQGVTKNKIDKFKKYKSPCGSSYFKIYPYSFFGPTTTILYIPSIFCHKLMQFQVARKFLFWVSKISICLRSITCQYRWLWHTFLLFQILCLQNRMLNFISLPYLHSLLPNQKASIL